MLCFCVSAATSEGQVVKMATVLIVSTSVASWLGNAPYMQPRQPFAWQPHNMRAFSALSEGMSALNELSVTLTETADRIEQAAVMLDVPRAAAMVAELEAQSASDGFWDDASNAEAVLRRLADSRGIVEMVARWHECLEDASAAAELEEADLVEEARAALALVVDELDACEVRSLMGGEYDQCGAVLSLTAGAGGVDAMDWTEMLLRMYTRWSESQAGFRVSLIERSDGEEAGLKSASLSIEGPYAYGMLRSERGTHRLVRLSPFNAANKRQTSFAGVEIMPILDETALDAVHIPVNDLEV